MKLNERQKAVLQEIINDIEKDAMQMDGMAFNGKNVSEILGHFMANTQALAKLVQVLTVEEA